MDACVFGLLFMGLVFQGDLVEILLCGLGHLSLRIVKNVGSCGYLLGLGTVLCGRSRRGFLLNFRILLCRKRRGRLLDLRILLCRGSRGLFLIDFGILLNRISLLRSFRFVGTIMVSIRFFTSILSGIVVASEWLLLQVLMRLLKL